MRRATSGADSSVIPPYSGAALGVGDLSTLKHQITAPYIADVGLGEQLQHLPTDGPVPRGGEVRELAASLPLPPSGPAGPGL
ncbi:hypothetical protein [Streptomyces sp. NPDC005283]|uniref:hypothetical protein n=1 Tax=Streptomyces sp. NPDC005283 TaxID=3156871 RepID=UPI003452D6BA